MCKGFWCDSGQAVVWALAGRRGDVAVISYHALDGLHLARIGIDWFYGTD